jgi:hypothetical protein
MHFLNRRRHLSAVRAKLLGSGLLVSSISTAIIREAICQRRLLATTPSAEGSFSSEHHHSGDLVGGRGYPPLAAVARDVSAATVGADEGATAPIVVCNEAHRFTVAKQLRTLRLGASAILLEPVWRITAPAVALAALQAQQSFP